jgi:hypothetical protein
MEETFYFFVPLEKSEVSSDDERPDVLPYGPSTAHFARQVP